jgi:hypothetical protein
MTIKLLIYSNRPQSPSWQFYSKLFARMENCAEIQVKCVAGIDSSPNLGDSNVALLFGSEYDLLTLRRRHPNTRLGHLEPRAAQRNAIDRYDFVVVNSIESADYFASPDQFVFIFPTFPIMDSAKVILNDDRSTNTLRIGYHGNKIHLSSMYPRITEALNRLREYIEIELWAMYNIRELGRWNERGLKGIKVNHLQYKPENYSKYISKVDIGIVPQLIPVRKSRLMRWLIGSPFSRFNERHDNFLMRFKETTNNGRAYVFAQYEIPVVADMTPSSCALFGESEYGYVAYSSNQWFNALASLARDMDLRRRMGLALKKRYEDLARPEEVINRFAQFLTAIIKNSSVKTQSQA